MPRDNISDTRRGFGGYKKTRVINTTYVFCPVCNTTRKHETYDGGVQSGRPAIYLQCCECGDKHYGKYTDRQVDKRSVFVQQKNDAVWDWLRENVEKIMAHNPVPKFQIHQRGVIGSPRRHKGKSYPKTDLHPEFLEYLRTPEAIKRGREMFDNLYHEDKDLYYFVYLRALGYSYKQIDDLDILPVRLTRKPKKKVGKGGFAATDSGRNYNRRALVYIINNLPDSITKRWEGAVVDTRNVDREERVTCPKCSGQDRECNLCSYPGRDWDGTVKMWMAEKYIDRIESGGIWA